MTGKLRAYFKRTWPVGLLLLVAWTLVPFKIHQPFIVFRSTDKIRFAGNNLIWLKTVETDKFTMTEPVRADPRPWTTSVNVKPVLLPIRVLLDAKIFPLWPYQAALALFALIVIARRWHANSKRRPGDCACGYNLHGNVGGICPECGLTVAVERASFPRVATDEKHVSRKDR